MDYINKNPWKGLNYYVEGDTLYGRSEEIEQLSRFILNNRQTVLYGKSGIGKSSIINAGIFPIAREEGLFPVSIRFDHASERTYMQQIREAIANTGVEIYYNSKSVYDQQETLWEFFHRVKFYNKENKIVNPLLIFDQFEEIFSLQKNENIKIAFFSELADLINDVRPSSANLLDSENESEVQLLEIKGNIEDLDLNLDIDEPKDDFYQKALFHIVFVIREDFLSYFERYTQYIPPLRTSKFPLLPLSEKQAKEVIMKPKEGLIDEAVALMIIRKVTGTNDFIFNNNMVAEIDAAILSLYLSRLYDKKREDEQQITPLLVNKFSEDIIKDFYEEAIKNIPNKEIYVIEDFLITKENRRNNVSMSELLDNDVDEHTLDYLINNRKLLRQFSYNNDLRIEFIHDVLCPVVRNRIETREKNVKIKRMRMLRTIMVALLVISAVGTFLLYSSMKRDVQMVEKKVEEMDSKNDSLIVDVKKSEEIIMDAIAGINENNKENEQTDSVPYERAFIDGINENNKENEQIPNNQNDNSKELPQGKWPMTATNLLKENDLVGMSNWDLKVMRNEIYARHGYVFITDDMKNYFNRQEWYVKLHKESNINKIKLSSTEINNIQLIKQVETELENKRNDENCKLTSGDYVLKGTLLNEKNKIDRIDLNLKVHDDGKCEGTFTNHKLKVTWDVEGFINNNWVKIKTLKYSWVLEADRRTEGGFFYGIMKCSDSKQPYKITLKLK